MNTQEKTVQENIETKKTHKIMDRPILSTILLYLFVTLVTAVFQLVKIPIWGVTDAGAGGQIFNIAYSFLTLAITELIYTKVWFKGEFEGTLKGRGNSERGHRSRTSAYDSDRCGRSADFCL